MLPSELITGIWGLMHRNKKIELSEETPKRKTRNKSKNILINTQFVTFSVTFAFMIVSFTHKGLKLYYEKGDISKVQSLHLSKIKLILTRLDAATTPEEMQVPGYNLHKLTGELKDFWSVKVDKNYRIIFRFEDENAHDVNYLDYH